MPSIVDLPHRSLAAATPKVPDSPYPRATGLTCSDIEAIVSAKLGWVPMAGSAQETVETAVVNGFRPGLKSQIHRSE